MIYIFIFSLTGLLIYQSEYYEKKHKKILSDLIAIAAVLTISTFAGLRDISVGTDVEYYLVKHFNWASMFKGRMWEYVVYLTTFEEVEPIYAFVQYIGYHIFHKVNFVLFILSFITHTFIYFGIKKKENEISVSFGWIIYCFIYFNTSLNIVRQSCAVAILFYIVMCYTQNERSVKKNFVLIIVAMGFHRSTIFVIGILLLLIWSYSGRNNILKRVLRGAICIFPFILRFFFATIANFSFLPLKYQVYFSELNLGQSSLLMDMIIYLMPTVVLVYLMYEHRGNNDKDIKLFMSMALISISCCVATNLLISRVSHYFVIFFCCSVPYTARIVSAKAYGRIVYCAVMIGWFAIMWYINIVSYGYGETYPYILGI